MYISSIQYCKVNEEPSQGSDCSNNSLYRPQYERGRISWAPDYKSEFSSYDVTRYQELEKYLEMIDNPEVAKYPPHDILEYSTLGEPREWELRMALAGWDKSQIRVSCKKFHNPTTTTVFIESRSAEDADIKEISKILSNSKIADYRFVRRGISQKKFAVMFPVLCDAEVVSVKMENGILSIRVKEIVVQEKEEDLEISIE